MFDPITAIAVGSVASAGVGLYGAYKGSKVKAPAAPKYTPPPEMDALPDAPQLSKAPEAETFPSMPNLPSAPKAGNLPGLPNLQDAPEMGSLPGLTNIPPPPKPSSFTMYDANGNVTGEAMWDEGKQTFSYKTGPVSPEQKAINDKRTQMRQQLLSNIDKTPEDRMRAYDEYAKSYSDFLHQDVDKRYQDTIRASEENLAGKGMLGSRAQVDTMAEIERGKRIADTDIANRSFMAREDLARADQDEWLRTLGMLDSQDMADKQYGLQSYSAAMQGAQMGNDASMKSYLADTANKQWQYGAEMDRWGLADDASMKRYLADTANSQWQYGAGLDLYRTQDDASMKRYLADLSNEQWQYGAGMDLYRTADDASMKRYLADLSNEQWQYNADMSRWGATEDAKINRWQGENGMLANNYNAGVQKYGADVNKWGNITNTAMDTATGLAYLYGYKTTPTPKG